MQAAITRTRARLIPAVAVLLTLFTALAVTAQQVRMRRPSTESSAPRPIDAEEQTRVIDGVIEAIGEEYVFPERVEALQAELRALAATPAYTEIDDSEAFARQVTDDLRRLTGDLHFSLRYAPAMAEPMRRAAGDAPSGPRRVALGAGAALDPDSDVYRAIVEPYARRNFDLRRVEVFDGNIGYLRIDTMPPLEPAKPTLDAAMAFLANTDAVVIDLRDTPGGVGGFIPYLMSYFFAEGGELLYRRHWGAEDRVEEYTTVDEIGGERRPDVPLYVLTNSATGSAAENLAFTLKHHGRATIVGETTAGGGHSARGLPLEGGFLVMVPAARVEHPVTGTGFEGVGVEPDVAVASSEALHVARARILDALLASDSTVAPTEIERAIAALAVERRAADATHASEANLAEYAGTYGIRAVTLEHGELRLQRQGGPKLSLERIGDDLFRMVVPTGARTLQALPDVRFERSPGGVVHAVAFVRTDGSIEERAERGEPGR